MVGCRYIVLLAAIASLTAMSARRLTFDRTVADIGTLLDTDNVQTVTFSFVNDGDEPITLSHVKATCGCTAGLLSGENVMPGQKGVVTLRYNPHNQIGNIDVKAFVYTLDDDKKPVATLRITGMVTEPSPFSHYKVQMGVLRLRRNIITRSGSGPQVERIACGNCSDSAVTLSALMTPPGVSIRTEPTVIPPHSEADVVIAIGDGVSVTKDLPIILDGISCTPSERTITIKAK